MSTYSGGAERQLNGSNISGGNPAFGNESLPSHIIVEQVEGLVDQFLLSDYVLPAPQTLSDRDEFTAPVQTSVIQHSLQVFKTAMNFAQ